jgi:type IV secretory pathway VirB10-like protein
MSSVLHPVGPEPRERYWVRRLAVLIAAVVAIGIVIALVGNAMSAGSAVQAEPAPPSIAPPTLPVTPAASPSPSDTTSPDPTASPTPGVSASATTTPSASAAPTDGGVVTPDPEQKAKTQRKTPATDEEKKKAAAQTAAKKAAAKQAAARKKAAAAVLATCPAGDLRPTLTGPKKVKAKKSATFRASLINGSSKSCYLKVTRSNYTLTIVSGKDKIWSSEDCPATVPASSRKLASQKSLDWKVTWDGRRSGSGCSKEREAPRAGYYWAIANFDDSREVRWRIILT